MATPTNLPIASVSGDVLTAAYVNGLRGAFRVLQVAAPGVTSTQVTNSTTTYADTGLEATITPQSATSKILVIVAQSACYKSAGNTENALNLRLLRGATTIQTFANLAGYTGTALQNRFGTCSTIYLDSPASTSALVYKTQLANNNATAEVGVQVGNTAQSTMILMEISA
jgi:hypothetical protein